MIRYLFFCIGIIPVLGMAQDIEQVLKAKPFSYSGSVAASGMFHASSDSLSGRDPFTTAIYANMNLSFYEVVNVPLSVNFMNRQTRFSHPHDLNQLGISPSYKWIRTYAGHQTMVLSPYTLNGHQFLGGGVELTPPGGFSLALMHGRLLKAVQEDTLDNRVIPSFRRRGTGARLGYNKDKTNIQLAIFRSRDDAWSSVPVFAQATIAPEENCAISLAVSQHLGSRVSVQVDLAQSALTTDTRVPTSKPKAFYPAGANPFFTHRLSSGYYHALKTGLQYRQKRGSIGLGYERVDPGFRTHGSYYFNNDLEHLTLQVARQMLNGKLNVSANWGSQWNNLHNERISSMKRVVGAIQMQAQPHERVNLSMQYSNFSSYTVLRSVFDDLNRTTPLTVADTLTFTHVTQQGNMQCQLLLSEPGNQEFSSSINTSISLNKASDKQELAPSMAGTLFCNGNLMYAFHWKPLDLSITPAYHYTFVSVDSMKNFTRGPMISVNKSWFGNKLRNSIAYSTSTTRVDGQINSRTRNARLSASTSIKEKHQLSIGAIYTSRYTPGRDATSRHDFSSTLGYQYTF